MKFPIEPIDRLALRQGALYARWGDVRVMCLLLIHLADGRPVASLARSAGLSRPTMYKYARIFSGTARSPRYSAGGPSEETARLKHPPRVSVRRPRTDQDRPASRVRLHDLRGSVDRRCQCVKGRRRDRQSVDHYFQGSEIPSQVRIDRAKSLAGGGVVRLKADADECEHPRIDPVGFGDRVGQTVQAPRTELMEADQIGGRIVDFDRRSDLQEHWFFCHKRFPGRIEIRRDVRPLPSLRLIW